MAAFDGELRVVYTPATQPGEVTVVSTTAVTEAEAARDAAQAARDQAVAAEGTFTAPADSVIGGLVDDGLSATGVAVQARVDARVVTKADVGLGSVDNTSDLGKPISTATQTALDGKAASGGILRGGTAKTFRTLACCLRLTAGVWEYLNDSGHAPDGVASVSVTADAIRVTYDFTALKVSTVSVTPDEAFAQADIRMGASVGLTYMDIKSLRGAAGAAFWDPLTLTTPGANIWVFGIFEV